MGKARFFYDNYITDVSMITPSSLRSGIVTDAKKEGTGSATLILSGSYTGTLDKKITIEIDSVAGGAEVGQATFRWTDGGGSWNGSGIATSAANILLEEGIYVKWVSGTGDDFAIADRWDALAINMFNAEAMIDYDRDSRFRSAALESPNSIELDFGVAKTPTVLVLFDHNLTSGATISLRDSTSTLVEAVLWNAAKIVHFIAAPAAYADWFIEITDPTNPDGYIEIGELFLGPYLELPRNYDKGYSRTNSIVYDGQKNRYGKPYNAFRNRQQTFSYTFKNQAGADVTSLESLLDAITDRSTGKFNPFYFNEDSAYPNRTWLVDLLNLPENNENVDKFSIPLEMIERMASRV